MSAPQRREALDAVSRLEAALLALEHSFATLDEPRGEAKRGAVASRPDGIAALSPEEHRRLTNNLEALLEEIRQLADFLASDASGPESPRPG